MTTGMGRGIYFNAGTPWTAVSRSHLETLSTQQGVNMATRVYFAALSRLEPAQYATFDMGEMRDILGEEGEPVSCQSATDAVRRAKDAGLISERSTVRQVWIDDRHAQVGKYRRGTPRSVATNF